MLYENVQMCSLLKENFLSLKVAALCSVENQEIRTDERNKNHTYSGIMLSFIGTLSILVVSNAATEVSNTRKQNNTSKKQLVLLLCISKIFLSFFFFASYCKVL